MVQRQNIHFLVFKRSTTENTPPTFPDDATLQQLLDEVVLSIDDPHVVMVALKDDKGIATIALSTVDMPIFNQIRAGIRSYTGFSGFSFETQTKQTFMLRNTATIYVPVRQKRYIYKPLFNFLFAAYPSLASDCKVIEQVRFTDNTPERPMRKGDTILIVGGSKFLEKLAQFDEDHVFHMNAYWNLHQRGTEIWGETQLRPTCWANRKHLRLSSWCCGTRLSPRGSGNFYRLLIPLILHNYYICRILWAECGKSAGRGYYWASGTIRSTCIT